MTEQLLQETHTSKRLRLLIGSRLAIATFLLAMAGYFRWKENINVPDISQTSVFVIIFLVYLLSVIYVLLDKFINSLKPNIYIQSIGDVLIITSLVYFTGGIRSIYPVFYQLVIIYSVLFLGRRGGLFIASGCAILYGILVNLQYYRVIDPVYFNVGFDMNSAAGYVFFRTLIYILSFYIIALLASFVVEREKKAQVLLMERENAFEQLDLLHRSIIESIDAGILTASLQGSIKSFNRAAENITGYASSEILNRDINEVFQGYPLMLEKTNAEGDDPRKGPAKRSEISITAKAGHRLSLGCSISPLNDHQGRRIGNILIFQDLSAIKLMEEALEKNRRLAFIGEMAAGLAHEMRNPMASISGSIQLLKRGLVLNDADDRLMQIILRGKDQLESFIKDFLLMARPAAGTRDLCDVNAVVDDVVEALHYIPEWDDRFSVRKDLAGPVMLHANKTEIRQILWNLCVNAVQAMPEGGTVQVSVRTLHVRNADPHLELRVADTGEGIPEEDGLKIFEPFYTTKEKGTGLGLAIVNRIVEGYKGKITIDGEYGQGAAFLISLPIHSAQ
jgi:two-component system sensor histidine kinase PilS (NtrC family)